MCQAWPSADTAAALKLHSVYSAKLLASVAEIVDDFLQKPRCTVPNCSNKFNVTAK